MKNFIYDLNKNLNFRNIQNDIRMIENIMNRKEYDYLSYLLYPEKYKDVKIPTEIPIPSCSFQMHNNIEINLDTNGNLFIMYNPFFLGNLKGVIFPCKTKLNPNIQYAQLTFLSSLFINNNNTKWGGKYYAVNILEDFTKSLGDKLLKVPNDQIASVLNIEEKDKPAAIKKLNDLGDWVGFGEKVLW